MPPPERLIGLNKRRRRSSPKPELPAGCMWTRNGPARIEEVEMNYRIMMNAYDSLPPGMRKLVQEHGPGAIKQLLQSMEFTPSHIPSSPDSTPYIGVDHGRGDATVVFSGVVWRGA